MLRADGGTVDLGRHGTVEKKEKGHPKRVAIRLRGNKKQHQKSDGGTITAA